jgi:hypothetical protein
MRTTVAGVLAALLLVPGAGLSQNTRKARGSTQDSPGGKVPPATTKNTTWDGKTLSQWRMDLSHEDASRRSTALLALLHFPEDASTVVRDVINRLHDPDVSPRAKACLVLRHIRVEGNDVPKVVKALSLRLYPPGTNPQASESQAIIRYEAAVTLERFVAYAHPVLPALIQGTKDRSSWEIRRVCMSILWRTAMDKKLGPDDRAVSAMLDALRGGSRLTYQEKLEILQGLAMMGQTTNQAVLAREISDLGSIAGSNRTPGSLRIWAYAGVAAVGDASTAHKAMEKIAKNLENKSLEVKAQAAHALGTLGEKAKNYVPALLKVVKTDPQGLAVNGACMALIRIKDTSEPVVSALLDLLGHKDAQHAGSAVKALVDLKVNDARVTGAMDKMLGDKNLDDGLRAYVRAGLEELKKPAKK